MKHNKAFQQLLGQYFTFNSHRLTCLIHIILGLFITQSVNLAKLSRTFSTKTKHQSVYKRLQRFMKYLTFSHKSLFLMICDVFDIKGNLTLCMDRTNWKFGKAHINYLVVSIAYKGISIPVIWSLLTDKKCGNSDFEDRRKLFDRILTFIQPTQIKALLCDREFLSGDWIAYLKSHQIPFVIRAKETVLASNSQGKAISFKTMFANLSDGKSSCLKASRNVLGCDVYICAKRLDSGELLILVSNKPERMVFDLYRIRWEIETLFAAMKRKGFNWEDTHMTHPLRLSNLLFVLTIAFIWAYRQGDILLKDQPRKLKKHGYPQYSIVRIGVDFIIKAISEITINPRKILSSIRMVFKPKALKITLNDSGGVL
ncbi:IS4 family transposase [Cysteiniphilum marinum]|uniref:IS4 family transposase n=1 Tax=Cysteiniphilum marinum TaxID=2774191 RepID=UPI001939419B|nr:IS4 family transposase [Cysteiniphilum marinum]